MDDDPDLAAAAIWLGYQARVMRRAPAPPDPETDPQPGAPPSIASLGELLDLF